jgi:hypothetical protein
VPIKLRTTRLATLACISAALTGWLTGCATDRLEASAPSGVNLSGAWKFDVNLSDDPDKLMEQDKKQQEHNPDEEDDPGVHHGRHGGGGPTGLPPMGGGASADDKPSRANALHRLLQAPASMLITQNGGTVGIRINMPDGTATADEYTAGVNKTIPYGQGTADCSSGWRGPAFVVAVKGKKGAFREDDYALDDEGHLIVTTDLKSGHFGSVELKRVYDRIKGT